MRDELIIVFCIVDSEFWSMEQLSAWADQTILTLEEVPSWVIDVANCHTYFEARKAISRALQDLGVQLPVETPNFLLGLAVVGLEKGRFSLDSLKKRSLEIADAYESDMHSIEQWHQGHPDYEHAKALATNMLKQIDAPARG